MKKALKAAITTSISEVLETMFFMTIDTAEDSDWNSLIASAAGERLFVTKINYQGPLSGYFLFVAPENILSAMTETFMGVSRHEVTEDHLTGTISEAINIIAGNTFSKLDDQAIFKLEIPEVVDIKSFSDISAPPGKEEIFFRIETPGGNLGLQLFYSV